MPAQPAHGKRFRLQGTDGIRREVRRSTDPSLRGLDPMQAFLQQGIITETFMERYAYAHVRHLVTTKQIKKVQGIVVGWDPRDMKGTFTEAVIQGIRKAGVDALVLGVVPTPLVPMFLMHRNAGGGFMVTASHNPQDQNGIKTFLAYRGMKLLPENDIVLTQALLKLKSIKSKSLSGKRIDCRNQALGMFEDFSLAPENSWIENKSTLKNIILVVDPARGALTGIAADVFRKAGFGRVIEVNNTLDGAVNRLSGVADLEGHTNIPAHGIVKNSGGFAKHKAILKLFELGRKNRTQIKKGIVRVAGAIFDADGDRFYRLEYNPFSDALTVLSGDETAFLQAQFLIKQDKKLRSSQAYVHTVESDLNTGAAAEKLGYSRHLSAVGDKWILLHINLMIVEARLRSLKGENTVALKKKLKTLKSADRFDVSQFQKLEAAIDRLEGDVKNKARSVLPPPFAVGSEETGHNITQGYMKTLDGNMTWVFCGNGLKSALNTFAATQSLLGDQVPKRYFSKLERPFPPGFKGTRYAYYVRQELFHNGSPVWKRIQKLIARESKERGYKCRALPFREDPDMLYLALESPSGTKAGIFVRNSGTENKISVNLRGTRKDARALKAIGELAVQLLFKEMKDETHHLYRLELHLLSRIAASPLPGHCITLPEEQRVLAEMGKQKLVEPGPDGFQLTRLGKWYILH